MGEMQDIEEAIRIAQLAMDSTPKDHPNRAAWLSGLGANLGSRYDRTGEMQDLENACSNLFQAWHCVNGVPFHRVRAAARVLKLLPVWGKFEEAAGLARDVIDLMPILSNRSLDRKDRQFVLSMFSGVAADACALLLEIQKPDQALQHLERGRAVILSQMMDDRSDISKLSGQYPDLACTYESLRDEVNTPLPDVDDSKRTPSLQRRRKAVKELDKCIREIRRLPGYDRFLPGQTTAEMQACAVEGSIVIVNVTEMRSDAIIVSSTAIKTLRLSELAVSDTKRWLQKKWNGWKIRARHEKPGVPGGTCLGYGKFVSSKSLEKLIPRQDRQQKTFHEYGGSGLDLPARCRSMLPGTILSIRLRMPTAELCPRTRRQSKHLPIRETV
jgi:hypothetical protein